MPNVYLKEGVILEPLINQWYAWPALISPLTAGAYFKKHYFPIIESYIEEPELHVSAINNPTMRAGPFLNYLGDPADVSAFFEEAQEALSELLRFSEATDALNKKLLEANGFSLVGLYRSIPAPLKGLVELGYDLHHSPSVRFIEPLVYRSKYYDCSLQSVRLRAITDHDSIFTLNTPMFADKGPIIQAEFASRFYDLVGRSRVEAVAFEDITASMPWAQMSAAEQARFGSYFTEEQPTCLQNIRLVGDELRIRYFGHATILLQAHGMSILTDPCISPIIPGAERRFDYSDLPEVIDVVLLTHAHQDHVLIESLLQLRHRIKKIVVGKNGGGFIQDASLKLMLEAIGFQNVVELGEMARLPLPVGELIGVPFLGEHGDLNIQSKLGYCVRLPEFSAMFLADSDVLDPHLYEAIHQDIGDIDALFIGMDSVGAAYKWLYAPLYGDPLDHARGKDRRINGANAEKAMEIVQRFKPKASYVYAMGTEPWISHITGADTSPTSPQNMEAAQFVEWCRAQGMASAALSWMADIRRNDVGFYMV